MMLPSIATALVLAVAWYTATNLLLSVAASLAAARVSDDVSASARRARGLLALRLMPAAGAVVVSALIFLPAHLWLEPENASERLGIVPLMWAAVGVLLVVRSAWRVAQVVRASARLARVPFLEAADSAGAGWVEMPLLDGIVLAGVIRPRVLVGAAARRVLSSAELDVAIAHEIAHRRAGDNLARALMQCVPDLFAMMPAGARVKRLWEAEAECLADARAAAGEPLRSASLASALVKVARLAGRAGEPACQPAWSTFHQARLLETRVRLLVADRALPADSSRALVWLGLIVVAAIGGAWTTGVPHALHGITEMVMLGLR